MLRLSIVFMFLAIIAFYFSLGGTGQEGWALWACQIAFVGSVVLCIVTAAIGGMNRQSWGSPGVSPRQ